MAANAQTCRVHDLALLQDLTVALVAALAVVTVVRPLGVPAIAGFLLAGALVGPKAFGLVAHPHDVELLSEVGVILLLFGIGLELSLDRLRRLWRAILIGGSLQVGLTLAAGASIALLLGQPTGRAVFLGMLVATSSTAIVLRGLMDRGEVEAPHGRLTLGILVFQDLCVLPMMLVLPALAGSGEGPGALLFAVLRTAALLTVVVLTARLLVPRVFDLVARTRQRDLFVLVVAATCLGIALAASFAGVSLALGAFLAGLVVAGTGYRHQALAEVIPMREILTSVFFVSIGMLLDVRTLLAQAGLIFGLTLAILVGKLVLAMVAAAAMRLSLRVTVLTGAALCQVGEFAFVLMRAAQGTSLDEPSVMEPLQAAIILSMLVTPFALRFGPHIAAGAGRSLALTRLLEVRPARQAADDDAVPHTDHVIIAGLGVTGQEVARALSEEHVPYVIVDLNPESVRSAAAEGEPAFFGDVTSHEVLEHLGLHHARALVLCVNDPEATRRAAEAARMLAPDVRVLVRVGWLLDVAPLYEAGARDVVSSELEAAAEVTERVLRMVGADEDAMRRARERVHARERALKHG